MDEADRGRASGAPAWAELDASAPRLVAWARARGLPPWSAWIAFAVAHVALARLGYLLVDPATRMAVVWPPIGLLLGVLLLLPPRRWPVAIAIVAPLALATSLLRGLSPALALTLIAGNGAQVLASAWLIRLVAGSRPSPSTIRGALALGLVPAATGGVLTAAAAALHLLPAGGTVSPVASVFWNGTSLGTLLVAPLLLAWLERAAPGPRVRAWELPALGAALAASLFLYATGGRSVWGEEVVLIPPLAWAAFRFGPRGATTAIGIVALVVARRGAWGGDSDDADPVGAAQFLLAVLGATSLLIAAAAAERRRTEAALRESEQRLRIVEAALDQASEAVDVLDEDGRVLWVNAARARALGLPKDRIAGRSIHELQPDLSPEDWSRRREEIVARGGLVLEVPIRAAGSRTVPGEIALAAVTFGGKRYFVVAVRDVSDRRRAESAARLAGIGTLAAGVAHEINNPLSYVLSNLAWLREHLPLGAPPPEEVRRAIEDVHDGAVRVRDIVQRLRLFSRPDESVTRVDVSAAARAAIAIAQNEIRHRASLVTRFADVPPVLGNENRLGQVFLNLVTNAAQAIPAGHADRNTIRVEVRPGDGGDVVAEVSDTGTGIPHDVRPRLFEPFFTTKAVGVGTGLGLFVCHGIVAAMGGRIEVESEPGAGSTFRVTLPPARADAPAAEPPLPSPAPLRRARVLVLDDDARVAAALKRVLQRDHDVEVSTDARSALARVRGGDAWDVVFCDLMMPEMSGMEWYEEVRRADPALADRVVFVTGGAFTEGTRDFLDQVPNPRIEKPFAPEELRAIVARRLRG